MEVTNENKRYPCIKDMAVANAAPIFLARRSVPFPLIDPTLNASDSNSEEEYEREQEEVNHAVIDEVSEKLANVLDVVTDQFIKIQAFQLRLNQNNGVDVDEVVDPFTHPEVVSVHDKLWSVHEIVKRQRHSIDELTFKVLLLEQELKELKEKRNH